MYTETPFSLWRKTFIRSHEPPALAGDPPSQQHSSTRDGSNHQRNRHSKGMIRSDSPEVVEQLFKTTSNGIKLEPQPTDDPSDPLNWHLDKKLATLAVISLAALAGGAVGLCNQFSTNVQAKIYHKTPFELSYSLSAAVAGLATGPIVWLPLANYIGKTSVLFWTQLASLACVAWSSAMTGPHNYIPFVLSKWLGATFASASFCLGGGIVIEIFYLHQRGRAFATYTACFILGAASGGTLSGFIVETQPWPVEFYWIIPLLGISAILIFLFLDDSTYDRTGVVGIVTRRTPGLIAKERVATLLPGHRILSEGYKRQRNRFYDSALIAIQPITLFAGAFVCITFGWSVPVQNLIGIFLQMPKEHGGYGFSPLQVSCFSFISWISVISAEVYGILLNDRVPLAVAKRRGIWRPEFRLYPLLLVPLAIVPCSLGLFGAALQEGLSYWAVAFSFFGINFADAVLLPVVLNYLSEGFGRKFAGEVFVVVNLYRFLLGALVPFFFTGWTNAIGISWTFGTMAFLSLVGFACTGVLWVYGDRLRGMTAERLKGEQGEDGDRVVVGRRSNDDEEEVKGIDVHVGKK
ncbi:Major Facilitator Superfamily [Lecanosticta acicola]|uniref:Major Facilitator Superfamily n=1 Tax=Lecanosticta acicola TaxID=111012 RepID=A0AAI9EAA2_9PEZI|nr:Major Facilitator Superfamily [Lecanosticta acicola]